MSRLFLFKCLNMFSLKGAKKCLLLLILVLIFLMWLIFKDSVRVKLQSHVGNESENVSEGEVYLSKNSTVFNWRDFASMAVTFYASDSINIATPVAIPTENEQELYKRYGYNVTLSDQLSMNRSVPDTRHKDCTKITYLSVLPKTTIIIVFYNERLSTLLRTVYSILNRTPNDLIQEIILVDDGSNWPDLQAPLDDFLQQHLPPESSKVRLLRLPRRTGLIVARMTGARNASSVSEVLIFLDAHLEMMYNWLPPLLEPIVLNPKACTVPSVDDINYVTLDINRRLEFRTYFNRHLGYRFINLQANEFDHPASNFRDYVMFGGAIVIRADYFWQLGGFDEGMQIWGYEQFELSFKIWMCGGELINVPCSRVGHLFRDPDTKGNKYLYGDYSFLDRNIRRLVDVWLDDEHRQHVYDYRSRLASVDPGDLSLRKAIRDSLQCKSFSWMLENIMPIMNHGTFGNGTICHLQHSELCIAYDEAKLDIVLSTSKNTEWNHIWFYGWSCDLEDVNGKMCLDSGATQERVIAYTCHFGGGNQKWLHDPQSNMIIQPYYNKCMSANIEKMQVDLLPCDTEDLKMKWLFNSYNETGMEKCREL